MTLIHVYEDRARKNFRSSYESSLTGSDIWCTSIYSNFALLHSISIIENGDNDYHAYITYQYLTSQVVITISILYLCLNEEGIAFTLNEKRAEIYRRNFILIEINPKYISQSGISFYINH